MEELEAKYRDIVKKIIKRTKANGWSYNKLAIMSGVSTPMVYKIVGYKATPSVFILLMILDALDMRLEIA